MPGSGADRRRSGFTTLDDLPHETQEPSIAFDDSKQPLSSVHDDIITGSGQFLGAAVEPCRGLSAVTGGRVPHGVRRRCPCLRPGRAASDPATGKGFGGRRTIDEEQAAQTNGPADARPTLQLRATPQVSSRE
jgi:hypothetical protein